jgi:hypothetical protein
MKSIHKPIQVSRKLTEGIPVLLFSIWATGYLLSVAEVAQRRRMTMQTKSETNMFAVDEIVISLLLDVGD